jgi:hypothetical protein
MGILPTLVDFMLLVESDNTHFTQMNSMNALHYETANYLSENETLNHSKIIQWFASFKDGQTPDKDDAYSGDPSTLHQ